MLNLSNQIQGGVKSRAALIGRRHKYFQIFQKSENFGGTTTEYPNRFRPKGSTTVRTTDFG